MSETTDLKKTASQQPKLGEVLKEARESKGLELSDVAELTHVRRAYLEAFEAGDYEALPEDVYAKNFLRLYAKAVGLDGARMVQLYRQERLGPPPPTLVEPAADEDGAERKLWPMIAAAVAVVLLIGLFSWWPGGDGDTADRTGADAETAALQSRPDDGDRTQDDVAETSAADSSPVLLSFVTEPEGAEVSIDNYALPGQTPLTGVPATPGTSRLVRVTLEGYQPYEASYDLLSDQTLEVTLVPVVPEASAVVSSRPGAAGDRLSLSIEDTSWLEAYSGTARGQGRTLVYTTVQPGQTFEFTLPVYLHIGNGGGVRYAIDGQDRGLVGSSGEVVSRAFTD